MLWMMGYDYDRIIQELYEVHDDNDTDSGDDSGSDFHISDYNSSDSSSYEMHHSDDDMSL